jgi:hypothetical protein
MLKFILLFFALAISQIAFGQTSKTIIPFDLTSYNNISIKAILNQKDTLRLMLHTGATDLTLIESAVKRLKSISFDKTIDGVKSWGGTTDGVRESVNNKLSIEGLNWDSLTITENKYSGQFTDGKCGLDLFDGKYLAFDFDKKNITVSQKMPKKLKGYEKHKLTYQSGMLFIEAACKTEKDSVFTHKFLIHSGYAGTILLDDAFANNHKLSEKLKITDEKALKDSYGNVIKTQKAILPEFQIGTKTLSDISVGFFPGGLGRQKMSAIGGDVLKRFNWVIDAERKFIYLKPNKNYDMAYSKV